MNNIIDGFLPYQRDIIKNWDLKLSNLNIIKIKEEDVKPLRGNTADYIFVDNFEFKTNE